jgi:hypothetical protein
MTELEKLALRSLEKEINKMNKAYCDFYNAVEIPIDNPLKRADYIRADESFTDAKREAYKIIEILKK